MAEPDRARDMTDSDDKQSVAYGLSVTAYLR